MGREIYFVQTRPIVPAGQVILFKKGLPCSIQVEYESERILVVKIDVSGKDFAIVNVYAPNTTKDKFNFF